MRSKEQLAERVREACHNSLLVAIGAACATPSKAASVASALGLSNEEEKLAKDVALFKRDAQTLYGTDFLTALQNILNSQKEKETMRTLWGDDHWNKQIQEEALTHFAPLEITSKRQGTSFQVIDLSISGSDLDRVSICGAGKFFDELGRRLPVWIHVTNPKLLRAAKAFGQQWEEKLAPKYRGKRKSSVVIIRQY